jgi:transglutaminase-like putative cysteine protease
MKIRFGYELDYHNPQPTCMVFKLHARPRAGQRLIVPDTMRLDPPVATVSFLDPFGNLCTRLEAPVGRLKITADALLEDSGEPEVAYFDARESPVERLPNEVLQYLAPSRYCESDLLSCEAFRLFGQLAPGWSRVQAICDFVHRHIKFGYAFARGTRTAFETYREAAGVCRDFSHLAIALCRGLNIPARYCSSYLGDIGVPVADVPMDFAAAIEVFLDGGWHTFDPRNNARRIGRLLVARGFDAGDCAISTAFGCATLQSFRVWTDQVEDVVAAA